jgi:hypothetical protein
MIATQPIEKGEAICTVRGAGLGFRGTGEGFGERLMGDAILRVSIGVSNSQMYLVRGAAVTQVTYTQACPCKRTHV